MSQAPDIRVVPVNASLRAALLALTVSDEQYAFVGRIEASLADAEACEGSEAMAILRDGEPIGFYRLEQHARSIADRPFDHTTVGLRSFFIDTRWQGQGLGTLALDAVLRDVMQRRPTVQAMVLTVNVRNTPALALYRRAGFRETGGLYHGGRSGPQHLMLCALPR